MVLKLLRIVAALLLWLAASVAPAADSYVMKFATLAPAGSTWMNIIEDWGRDVTEQSGGRLTFKFYPGGVAGDEPDVLRKIRLGQFDGGAFSGYAIGKIYSPARVLEIPFLFRDVNEVDFVRDHFRERFEQGFRDNGFELVGWMEIGFVHFFSRTPIHSMDELRKQRIWLWQGDELGMAFFHASGISPVPLSITDVYTSLSTGLIDTVYSTPLAAIAMQWFNKTDYMSEVPMTNAMGAMLVSQRFYQRLPADLGKLLTDTGMKTGRRLVERTRADNAKSTVTLREHGLKTMLGPDEVTEAELFEVRDRAAAELIRTDYIPEDVFTQTTRLLEVYRRTQSATPAAGAPSN
jgi:TRAP-type C4-dicarboxylate transport system substrate-binding protein